MGVNDLDNLAANGIINFDADAYAKGTTPRYVGDPNGYVGLPFEQPLYGIAPGRHLGGNPAKDAFIKQEGHGEEGKHKLGWKEALLGTIVAGLAVFGGIKGVALAKRIKAKKSTTPPAPASGAAGGATAAGGTTKTSFGTKVKSAATQIVDLAKKCFSKGKTLFNKLPKGGKIAVGTAGVLAGLYTIYKMFTGKKPHEVIPGTTISPHELGAVPKDAGSVIPERDLSAVPDANPQLTPMAEAETKPQV